MWHMRSDSVWAADKHASRAAQRAGNGADLHQAKLTAPTRAEFMDTLRKSLYINMIHACAYGTTEQSPRGRDGYPDTHAHPEGPEPGTNRDLGPEDLNATRPGELEQKGADSRLSLSWPSRSRP